MTDILDDTIKPNEHHLSADEIRKLTFSFLRGILVGTCMSILAYAIFLSPTIIKPKSFPNEKSLQTLSYFETTTYPMEIKLIIEPLEQIKKVEPGADAYSYAHQTPCSIHIPSNMKIVSIPKSAIAKFYNQDYSDVIAHELLHCMVGSWHG